MSIAPSAQKQSHRRRDRFATVGLSYRFASTQVTSSTLSSLDRRVFEAVAGQLLASWSRLSTVDHHLTRTVCGLIGRDPQSRSARSHVGASLGNLHTAGVLLYRPASGLDPAVVSLPEPPDSWTDPTCGVTAGELRSSHRRNPPAVHDEEVTQQASDGGSPTPGVTLYEDRPEDSYSPPAPSGTGHHPPPDDLGREEKSSPTLAAVAAALPTTLAAELRADRRTPKLAARLDAVGAHMCQSRIVQACTDGLPPTDKVRSIVGLLLAQRLPRLEAKQHAHQQRTQAQASQRIEAARRYGQLLAAMEEPFTDAEVTDLAAQQFNEPDLITSVRQVYRHATNGKQPVAA